MCIRDSIWSSLPPNSNHHSAPDTSHENRVATMITRLAADGFVFDSTDVQRLSRTFTERIWNGRTDWEANPGIQDSPWFHNYIDGSDEPYRTYVNADGTEGMNGFVYDGWIRLGEFDGEAQAAGEALLGFVQSFGSNINAIRQRNGSSYGRVMLAGNLARNLRFTVDRQDVPSGVVSAQLRAANLTGDLDRDGTTGYSDFLVLSANFGAKDTNHELGDLDRDGVVGFSDFLILSASFSTSGNR